MTTADLPARGSLWRRIGKATIYRVDTYIVGRNGVESIELYRVGSRGRYTHPTVAQFATDWTPAETDDEED